MKQHIHPGCVYYFECVCLGDEFIVILRTIMEYVVIRLIELRFGITPCINIVCNKLEWVSLGIKQVAYCIE